MIVEVYPNGNKKVEIDLGVTNTYSITGKIMSRETSDTIKLYHYPNYSIETSDSWELYDDYDMLIRKIDKLTGRYYEHSRFIGKIENEKVIEYQGIKVEDGYLKIDKLLPELMFTVSYDPIKKLINKTPLTYFMIMNDNMKSVVNVKFIGNKPIRHGLTISSIDNKLVREILFHRGNINEWTEYNGPDLIKYIGSGGKVKKMIINNIEHEVDGKFDVKQMKVILN